MWIRSQDKENLINAIAIGVDIGSNIFAIINNDKVDPIVIGNYSTKEKALKVLDDIQSAIIYMEEAVVVMPQDDEVITNE